MRDDDQPSRPDQPLRVAVRAYARHRQPPRPRTRWAWTRRPGAARFLLVLDTETTTDPSQRLVFGVYRLGEVRDDPRTGEERLTVFEEGFVYGDDLPARDPAGFAILETYVGAHRAETAPGESTALRFLSRTAFVNEVLYPAAFEGQAIVVGFNLPFDLSRLAVEASPARHRGRWWPMGGGWSFVLWRGLDGRPHRYRPRLVIKHGDKTRAQIAFTSADYQPTPKRRTRRPLYRGRFLDLKTLTFALTDRSHSLASACVAFGVATAKHSVDQHGVITPDYLEYGRQDVRATQGLYLATRQEYQRHALDAMPWDIKSPASIAKGYLRTMGISNPMDRVIGLTPDQLGAAAAAYFGGQAEVRIRHTVVPVVATDVTSMYPTVNVLAQLQTYLTAAVLRSEACTAEAQRVLDQITLERVLDPVTWPTLRFFAEILPDDDHLPVRAAFGGEGGSYTLSVNPYTSDQTAWYAGFDLARSILATGRVPQIRRAFRMAAEGQLALDGAPVSLTRPCQRPYQLPLGALGSAAAGFRGGLGRGCRRGGL